jgi:NAD(P)-dependent dehydrogenase (short-subunit alcohol dehydrogenase family)
MLLQDKVALVTGGGRGIGRAHALELAAAGATIIVNDLGGSAAGQGADPQPAQSTVAEIEAAGGQAIADLKDISSWERAHELVNEAVSRFGKLDIIVNNAGICRPTDLGSLAEDDWDRQMDVNAKSVAALLNAATSHWQEAGAAPGRAIVNTASPQGAHPTWPIGMYSVSKAAVLALTQVAAMELAQFGVRVNALAPIARTRMVGEAADTESVMPRDGNFDRYLPEHVARVVLYLVSPLCQFTGRLFGARGDDIFLYSEWGLSHHANNACRMWTPETLAAALDDLPLQDQRATLAPQSSMERLPSPPDEILAVLRQASGLAR